VASEPIPIVLARTLLPSAAPCLFVLRLFLFLAIESWEAHVLLVAGVRPPPGHALPSSADTFVARSRDGLYDTALAESEREAVAELLGYLENVNSLPIDRGPFPS